MVKTSAPTVQAIRVNDGSTLMTVAGASALIAPIVGIGLAAVESILAVASFVAARMEQRQTGRALKRADHKQLEAIGALVRHVGQRREEAAWHGTVARRRPDPESMPESSAPDEAGARAPVGSPLPTGSDAETLALQSAAHDAIIERMLCAARARDAGAAVVDAGLTLGRDTVVQGALVGSATALTLKDLAIHVFVALKQVTLSTPILGVLMGVAHIVTGGIGLWRALKDIGRQCDSLQAVSPASHPLLSTTDEALPPLDRQRKQRIASDVGKVGLAAYERSRRRQRGNAIRSALWSGLRILYGSASAALCVTSLMVVLGVASGGAAIPIAIAALGTGWLVLAVVRQFAAWSMKAKEQRAVLRFAGALKEATGHPDLAGGLQACPLEILKSLPSCYPKLKLDRNKYYRAALLAKSLHIDSSAHSNKRSDTKTIRVQASATLQLIGVPREMTQLLKRSSIQASYSWIVSYLGASDNGLLVATDPAISAVTAVRKGELDSPAIVAATIAGPTA